MKLFALLFFLCIAPVCFADSVDLQSLIDSTPVGGTLHLSSGTYHGQFEIHHPLTLEGAGAILDARGNGTVLRVFSSGVAIRDLVVQHSGTSLGFEDTGVFVDTSPGILLENITVRDCLFGIQVRNSPDATVRKVHISGYPLALGRRGDGLKIWYSPRIHVLDNTIESTRDTLVWYSDGSLLKGNRITSNRYGIHYMYSGDSIAEENTITLNSVGIYVMYGHDVTITRNSILANRGPSGYGVAVKESDRFHVMANRLFENRVGIHVDNSPVTPPRTPEERALFENNRLYRNDVGVAFVGIGKGTWFHRNDLVDNWQAVSTKGANRTEADWEENYWSDYIGIDPKHTGFGIPPYRTSGLMDSIMDKNEGFRLFQFGPAVLALEFAARAVPWLAPDPKALDPKPSMRAWQPVQRKKERAPFLAAAFLLGACVWIGKEAAS